MNKSLKELDKKMYDLINLEFNRQKNGLELIASENFTSKAVMDCLGSILTNKYSEGLPHKRYYGGNEVIDKIENLCISRALKVFKLNSEIWDVNVQPYSGSVANLAAYLGILKPHDRIMGLDLPSGGHLSHGFYTNKKKVSSSSIIFESLPYSVNKSGLIDYENLNYLASIYKPKLIICGYSAYPRDLDYKKFREIADKNNSYLLCDMAHFNGFVATGILDNPFDYCDIVTTTTHKTLRGPRAGMIFFNKNKIKNNINFSVFPGLQGGPHENKIAAIAVQLKEIMTPEFTEYMKQVQSNARVMANKFINLGYNVCTGGTDNHIILIDLKDKNINVYKIEKICELVNISINKNSVFGDKSALSPGGIRIGTSALTTRGLKNKDFIEITYIIDELIRYAIELQKKSGKKIKDFIKLCENDIKLNIIKSKVINFIKPFEFY